MNQNFDDWVREAPARHTAVFALLILATVALLTGACAPRQTSKCDAYATYTSVNYNYYPDGSAEKIMKVSVQCIHTTTVTQW